MKSDEIKLTKEEAIKRHRELWNWVADETLKRKKCVDKAEYFEEHYTDQIPRNTCWCCEYAERCSTTGIDCNSLCPINWGTSGPVPCCTNDSLYSMYYDLIDSTKLSVLSKHEARYAAGVARAIANLPERKDV